MTISSCCNDRLERLFRLLIALGRDIDIVIRQPRSATGSKSRIAAAEPVLHALSALGLYFCNGSACLMSSKPMRPCYEASFMVKFLEKQDHAVRFLSGAMLARRLNYYKVPEGDSARWDPDDGLRTYRHVSDKPAPASRHFTYVGTVGAGAPGAPRIRAMEISYAVDEDPYVICLSRFFSEHPDSATCLNRLAQHVREAGKMGPKFGTHAVVIDNRHERTFLDMVRKAATDLGYRSPRKRSPTAPTKWETNHWTPSASPLASRPRTSSGSP